jgi:hypothetical protein
MLTIAEETRIEMEALSVSTDGTWLFSLPMSPFDNEERAELSLSFVLRQGSVYSAPLETSWTMANYPEISVDPLNSGTVYFNEVWVITGDDFIWPEEGQMSGHFHGLYTDLLGSVQNMDLFLPMEPTENTDRKRAQLRLSTALGGPSPGVFEGSFSVTTETIGGGLTETEATPITLNFAPPTIFEISTEPIVPGQIVTVFGGGFLGHPSDTDEVSLLHLEGSLVEENGANHPIDSEQVLTYLTGSEAALGFEVGTENELLLPIPFPVNRGEFSGIATLITIKETEEFSGDPLPVSFELSGVEQVVEVRFLIGFADSLDRYGLSLAQSVIETGVLQRMASIYASYQVRFITTPPEDRLAGSYALLEIGGPDPNGLGLFGYDNTPGKDVGNLRLYDTIGGENTETQCDGFPGFGGVFIESYLYWSSHPELPLSSPNPPPVDPLFDEIFDPVRANPVTSEDLAGLGEVNRLSQVERATNVLSALIGESAAHEIGHSLGLSQPYGSIDAFHTASPGPGCLMDTGAERPFGERAAEPNYEHTQFCEDEAEYLESILSF